MYCHFPEEIESSSYGDSYLDEDEFGDVDSTSNTSGSCSLFPNAGLEPELLTMLESSSSPNEVIFRNKHALLRQLCKKVLILMSENEMSPVNFNFMFILPKQPQSPGQNQLILSQQFVLHESLNL